MTISVVIPAYNTARWLPDALESVRRQTYPNWEAIVVDDGSTDGTSEMVEGYREQESRIRLLKLPANRGPAAARNRGMLDASGEYLAFLDADDIWLADKLEKQLMLLKAQPGCDACYTQFEVIDDWRRIIRGWPELSRTFWHNPVDALALARGNYVSGSASGVLMRRSLVTTVGLFNEAMRGSEDLDYWYRIALRTRFCLAPEVLVQIRQKSETRLFATRRNLLGSLDFIRNARAVAPTAHRRMLKELEVETRFMLCSYYIGSSRIFRETRLGELFLFGKQNKHLRKLFQSLFKLGRRDANPWLREEGEFQEQSDLA